MLEIVGQSLLKAEAYFIIPVEGDRFLMSMGCWLGLFDIKGRCLRTYQGHRGKIIYCSTYRTPERKTIVIAGDNKGILHYWDMETTLSVAEPLKACENYCIFYLDYLASDGSKKIIAINRLNQLYCYNIDIRRLVSFDNVVNQELITILCVTLYRSVENHNILVIGTVTGRILRWDIDTRTALTELVNPHQAWITCCTTYQVVNATAGEERTIILAGDSYGRLLRWDAATALLLEQSLLGHEHDVTCCTTYQDTTAHRTVIVSGDSNGRLLRWDAQTGELLDTSLGQRLRRWNPVAHQHLDIVLRGHIKPVRYCTTYEAEQDGARVIAASNLDGDVACWNAQLESRIVLSARQLHRFVACDRMYNTIDGSVIAIISDLRGHLHRYDIRAEVDCGTLPNQPKQSVLFWLSYTTTIQQVIIIAIYEDNTLRCWDASSGNFIVSSLRQLEVTMIAHFSQVKFCTAYQAQKDGDIMLIGNNHQTVFQFNINTLAFNTIQLPPSQGAFHYSMVYHANRKTIFVLCATRYQRSEMLRWDAETAEVMPALKNLDDQDIMCCTTYSAEKDVPIIVIATSEGRVLRQNLITGVELPALQLPEERNAISCCTTYRMVKDQSIIIIASDVHGRLFQWQANTGRLIHTAYLPYSVVHFHQVGNQLYLILKDNSGYLVMQDL